MRRSLISLIVSIAMVLVVASVQFKGQPNIAPAVHAQEGCSDAYGFYRTGTTAVGPLGAVGIATFDGVGTSTARQTIRKNGITTSDLFTDPADNRSL